ncbi:MAG: exodeoxyribonuclease III [Actinomycetota bacterium]|jgi:exodeoxyribonuclease-3|nr:exodeoxyribonuclease III [Actinomycetota bacterium]
MRLVTWNINSLNARQARVEALLGELQPDICCLQETKIADRSFPAMAFEALGYESAHHGNGRWNGVAILSRVGLSEARAGFVDDEADSIEECRLLQANCGGTRVMCVYVPNGRSVDSEHYAAKLTWLARLRDELGRTCDPTTPLVVCGDFNIAPGDDDVFDPAAFVGATHVTPQERAALGDLLAWGLVDAQRHVVPCGPGPFTWWDYRAGAFHKGEGMRIDLALCTRPVAEHLIEVRVEREARKKGTFDVAPSDHAPLVLDWQ